MSNNFFQLAKVNSSQKQPNQNVKQNDYETSIQSQILNNDDEYSDDDNLDNNYDSTNVFNDNNKDFIDFKKNVKEWLLIDDDIMKLQNAIKERRVKKNELTPKIMDFMNNYQINDLNTQNGKLKFTKTQHTKPLNKQFLMAKIADYFKDMNKGEKITNFILENRDKEERMNLRRVKEKKQQLKL